MRLNNSFDVDLTNLFKYISLQGFQSVNSLRLFLRIFILLVADIFNIWLVLNVGGSLFSVVSFIAYPSRVSVQVRTFVSLNGQCLL